MKADHAMLTGTSKQRDEAVSMQQSRPVFSFQQSPPVGFGDTASRIEHLATDGAANFFRDVTNTIVECERAVVETVSVGHQPITIMAHRKARLAREAQYIESVLMKLFSGSAFLELDQDMFRELLICQTHIMITDKYMDRLFSDKKTVGIQDVRTFIQHVKSKRSVNVWSGMWKDWGFLATFAYLLGSTIYVVLNTEGVRENYAGAENAVDKRRVVVSYTAGWAYLIGSLGFGWLSFNMRKLKMRQKRDMAVHFCKDLIRAGKSICEAEFEAEGKATGI
jgi:hypothetical protein